MTRITSTILVVLLLMNGATTMMTASGLSEDLGVELAPGVDKAMEDVVENAKKGFNPGGGGIVESLYGILLAGLSTFKVLIQGVFSAPSMMMNLGFPAWFVVPVFAPMYLIATLEFIYMASGRDMV